MKYHIERNTVQETLVIPIYARKMCSELYPNLFRDETAVRLIDEIDYDFSALAKKSQSMMQQFGYLECAMRQSDLACEVRDYLQTHPNAAVVNLGCGLDVTGRACDNSTCKIYNIDFPDVIAVRDALLPAGEREKNIPCNLNDTSWFHEIDASGGAVFFAAANRKAVKLMLKTWIKDAKIKDVGAYFAVSDAKRELSAWSDKLRVSSRGYMLGYNDLRNQNVRKFFRFLSKVGDGMMNMQIVRLDFAKETAKHE